MTKQFNHHDEFRSAIAHLAQISRQHSDCSGGRVAMQIISSLALRAPVSIDLGAISHHLWNPFDLAAINAAMTAIRYGARCEWPDDIISVEEIYGWKLVDPASLAAA